MSLLEILNCFVLLRVLLSLLLGNFRSCDRGHAVDEFGPEEDVSVVEHAILQGNDNKLKKERNIQCWYL
jgi:hypothetical protein